MENNFVGGGGGAIREGEGEGVIFKQFTK